MKDSVLSLIVVAITMQAQAVQMMKAQSSESLRETSAQELCVTEGEVQTGTRGVLAISAPKVRAVLRYMTEQNVSLRFRYGGATAEMTSLQSGEVREQFGLKLAAANGCNVLYAIWRVQPENKIVVQLKRNPGKTRSSECGNQGYKTMKPVLWSPVPVLTVGAQHVLSASLINGELVVMVDEAPVWRGLVGSDLLDFEGPVGIRTDNVKLDFDLFTGPATREFACRREPGGE